MRVAVSGVTGFVGTALAENLSRHGHEVVPMVRGAGTPARGIRWDPVSGEVDAEAFSTVDAVVHLAGENISAGRWTDRRKAAIRESRVRGTELLADAVARCSRPPRVFACASAVGVYGSRGDEGLDETSHPGEGF